MSSGPGPAGAIPHLPPEWDGGQRRRYLDALLAYVAAPGPDTGDRLRAAATGVEREALAFATAVVDHPLSKWPQRLQELRAALDGPPAVPPPEPTVPDAYLALLDGAGVQLAWRTYRRHPGPASRASLYAAAGTDEAGAWLAGFADALRRNPGSAWLRRLDRRRAGHSVSVESEAPVAMIDPGRRRHRPRRSLAWPAAAAAAAVVLALGATALVVDHSPPTPSRPPVPASWRLAGSIHQPAWQVAGREAGGPSITCPGPTACFASVPSVLERSSTTVVEASTDGGASWTARTLPDGMWLTAPLACPTPATCVGAGAIPGAGGSEQVVAAVTSDGGSTWAVHPLPTGVPEVVAVACPTPATCVGAGATPSSGQAVAVRTADGGTSWSTVPLPSPFYPSADGLACSSPADCVVAGITTESSPDGTPTTADALGTTDGGAHWTAAALPSGLSTVRAVSCAPGGGCLAFAEKPTATAQYHNVVLRSTAANSRTWQVAGGAGMPLGYVSSVSCPAAGDCWASGATLTATGHPSVAAIVVTHDGGASWATVGLPRAVTAFRTTILSVSCPAVDVCYAIGTETAPAQVVLRGG